MTAIPVPPVSRLPDGSEASEDQDLVPVAEIKKKLDFGPLAIKKRVSRLSQSYQEIASKCMKVYLRLRPFTDEEVKNGEDQRSMDLSEDGHILTHTAPKDSNMFKVSSRGIGDVVRHYTFTQIFNDKTQQKEFFEATAQPIVQDFIEGENALIFTYGVTNAGKTYTIQGKEGNEGIVPRSVELIFKSVGDKMLEDAKFRIKMAQNLYVASEDERKTFQGVKNEIIGMADEILSKRKSESASQQSLSISESLQMSEVTDTTINETGFDASIRPQSLDSSKDITMDNSVHGPVKYVVFVSFIEIYKEIIYDLLVPLGEGKKENRTALRLGDDRKGVPYVRGMREIQANSEEEVMKILAFGRRNLHVATTKLNKDSSRSHCIFTLTLVQVPNIAEPHSGRVSKISFCDLAGSERTNKTREDGDRLKEASKINTSLLNLGRCLDALRHNQKRGEKQQHVVPFRESRVTRLFQNFLTGQGRACMIVNANMCASAFDETAHVMKFSAIAQEAQVITQPIKKSRSTLFDAKVLKGMAGKKNARATIAWERTPLKEEKEEEDEEQEEDSSEEESESDEEEEVELDVACWKNREKKFLSIIERMKKLVVEERKKTREMEWAVRKEVAEGFENHIVQIEEHHKERIEETIEIMEEEQQKRLVIMANMKDWKMEELKERTEKIQWELAAKHTNTEKKLEETEKMLESKISELQVLEEKLTSTETEANVVKIDIQKKDEELAYLRRKLERKRHSSSVLDENQFIEDLQKENEEGRSIIKSLMEECGEKRDRAEELEDENERLRTEMEALKESQQVTAEKANVAGDVSAARNEDLEMAQNELVKLKQQLSEVEHNAEAEMQEKLTALQKLKSDFERSQNQNNELEKAVAALNAEVTSAQQSTISSQNETSVTKEKLAKMEEEAKALRKQTNSLQEDLKNRASSLDRIKNKLTDLTGKLNTSEETVATLSSELAIGKTKNAELEVENAEMKTAVAAAEELSHDLAEKLKELTDREKTGVDEVAKLKQECDKDETEIATLKEENEKLKSSLKAAEASAQSVESKIKGLTDGRKKVDDEMTKLRQECDKEKSDHQKMKARFVEAETSLEATKTAEKQLNDDIRQQKSKINDLEQSVKLSKENHTNLTNELKNQQELFAAEKKNWEERLKDVERTKAKASQDEIEKLQKDLKESKSFETQLVKESERLQKTVEKLQRENSEIAQKSEDAAADISKLKEEVRTHTSERDDLLKNIENVQKELTAVKKERENLAAQARTEQEKAIEEYEVEKANLVKNKQKLEEKIAELQKSMQETREENEKASARASETHSKLLAEYEESRTKLKQDHQKEKDAFSSEIKLLKAEVEKAENSKEKEMKSFRDNRDRILAALQEQINNLKSSNDTLKASLDEAMKSNVKLQSQNAQYMAENKKLREKEDAASRSVNIGISASATLVPKLVRVKDEPKSPEPEPKKVVQSTQKSDHEETSTTRRKSEEKVENKETAEVAKEAATNRGVRRTKSGSSTSTRSTKRTRRAAARPATPHAEAQQSDDEKEELPSPRKTRRVAGRKKSSTTSIKAAVSAEQGVLDDSELMRETGNSQMFPQPTMELDVTPQLSKKTAKTGKKTMKLKDEEHSSEADDSVFRSRSIRRTRRANKNNNNASNPSEDEDQPASAAASGLTKVGGMIKNSPVGQAFKRIEAAIAPASKSPSKAKNASDESQVRQSKRGKRKLRADDISLPLEATPSPDEVQRGRVVPTGHLVNATPSRRLRYRK